MYTEMNATDRLILLEQLIQKANIGFVIIDQNHQIVEANERFVEMLGYNKIEEVLGLYTWDYETRMSREEIEQTFQDLSKVAIHIESVHRRKDGTTYPIEVSMGGASIQRPEGVYNAVMCICQDITLRKETEESLRYLSLHDQLTGVYNRVYFDELMDAIETRGQYPVTVLLGDLDDLKIVNDEMGHVNGDDLLRKTAVLIDSSLRKDDTIARYGGDEFVVILPGTDEQSALRVLERIQERIHHYNARKKGPVISITIGSATAYDQSIPLKQVFELADKDMYQKKQLKKLNQAANN